MRGQAITGSLTEKSPSDKSRPNPQIVLRYSCIQQASHSFTLKTRRCRMSSSNFPTHKRPADVSTTESHPWLAPVVLLQLLGILAIAAGFLIALLN
jgi:hypothetical protein